MSTQHRDERDLLTKLDRLEKRSQADHGTVFNNLGHLINIEMLRLCYHGLDGSKAVGIDGMTKEMYAKTLAENLDWLLKRIRSGSYHPKVARIHEIEKSDGTMRPLAISCFEDKIVQDAVKRILERIYEPIFLNCSHGFRPKRGCQTALVALDHHLKGRSCGAILEIDLQKCLNTIPHGPLTEWLKRKIAEELDVDNIILRTILAQNTDLRLAFRADF